MNPDNKSKLGKHLTLTYIYTKETIKAGLNVAKTRQKKLSLPPRDRKGQLHVYIRCQVRLKFIISPLSESGGIVRTYVVRTSVMSHEISKMVLGRNLKLGTMKEFSDLLGMTDLEF